MDELALAIIVDWLVINAVSLAYGMLTLSVARSGLRDARMGKKDNVLGVIDYAAAALSVLIVATLFHSRTISIVYIAIGSLAMLFWLLATRTYSHIFRHHGRAVGMVNGGFAFGLPMFLVILDNSMLYPE